ncbi:MAG: tRNA (adenosine(37)-N6)-threonylcarbamoyltransferase complex transferase subunit TsaD [Vicingaceae bacterium]
MTAKPVYILAIESSCDDTGFAVLKNNYVLSNIIANQKIHEAYGGVVPELASRAHQKNLIPALHNALEVAGIDLETIDAIAYTNGPGLLGSLLVGSSFAKGLSIALNKPLIIVNHMQAHILAHFIKNNKYTSPPFPFICLTVSGGHTQLVKISAPLKMEILGETLDDAAGEAFDKIAKLLKLPYPGGPLIDKYAQSGNPDVFEFPHPNVDPLKFSFSGLKTSVLYFLNKETQKNPHFIDENLHDICASIQKTIVDILITRIKNAIKHTGIKHIAIAGGVSANSLLRKEIKNLEKNGCTTYIPPFEYCTDNAAMIGIVGYYKFLEKDFADISITPQARLKI